MDKNSPKGTLGTPLVPIQLQPEPVPPPLPPPEVQVLMLGLAKAQELNTMLIRERNLQAQLVEALEASSVAVMRIVAVSKELYNPRPLVHAPAPAPADSIQQPPPKL